MCRQLQEAGIRMGLLVVIHGRVWRFCHRRQLGGKPSMKNWHTTHEIEGDKLHAKGFRLIAKGISIDEMILKSRRKEYPTGSIWLWSGGQVWAPQQQEQRSAAE
jgi:hypothetical protein